jgi:hypothetical protein
MKGKYKRHLMIYALGCTLFFSRVRKACNLGIIGGFPKDRLTSKVANHAKMKPRIQEEKCLGGIVRKTHQILLSMQNN